jgi:nitrile hydratase subunit beta
MNAQARYHPGQVVRVRDEDPPVHHRTPWYIKGKIGRVDAVYAPWPNPEVMAYGHWSEPRIPVYRIEFEQSDLWDPYPGPSHDRLIIDVFEHWLEPAEEKEL